MHPLYVLFCDNNMVRTFDSVSDAVPAAEDLAVKKPECTIALYEPSTLFNANHETTVTVEVTDVRTQTKTTSTVEKG